MYTRYDRIHALMPTYADITQDPAEQYRMARTAVDSYDQRNGRPRHLPPPAPKQPFKLTPIMAMALLAVPTVMMLVAFLSGSH